MYCLAMGKPGPKKTDRVIQLAEKAKALRAAGVSFPKIAKMPEFSMSHQMVQKMITSNPKAGSGPCSKCGRDCECLHRHHTDYAKDKVIHVCPTCHRSLHKITPEAKKAQLEYALKQGLSLSGLRLRANIPMRAMARHLQISHTYLWQMEKGQRRWPTDVEFAYRAYCQYKGKARRGGD